MRISDEDRSLAHELALVWDLDSMHEGALRVILSSHRQLPADEKPNAGVAQKSAPVACPSLHQIGPNTWSCSHEAGHEGYHRSADGFFWSGPGRLCGSPLGAGSGITCDRQFGHLGEHHSGVPGAGSYRHWPADEPCGEQMPIARETATCGKPDGHPGKHVVFTGELTGSSWYNEE